jgi:hypothetical protein
MQSLMLVDALRSVVEPRGQAMQASALLAPS